MIQFGKQDEPQGALAKISQETLADWYDAISRELLRE
jgi:hypothetical protein